MNYCSCRALASSRGRWLLIRGFRCPAHCPLVRKTPRQRFPGSAPHSGHSTDLTSSVEKSFLITPPSGASLGFSSAPSATSGMFTGPSRALLTQNSPYNPQSRSGSSIPSSVLDLEDGQRQSRRPHQIFQGRDPRSHPHRFTAWSGRLKSPTYILMLSISQKLYIPQVRALINHGRAYAVLRSVGTWGMVS